VPVVVVEVTAHQGERESRLQGEGAQVLEIYNDGEVREMRDAATVLAIIRERGRRGLQPEWAMRMAARRRKTLLVCRACHESIHYHGCPTRQSR
jgi:hypothetical protein